MEFVVMIIQLAVAVAVVAGGWKIFTKAGQPGWACIVPFYSTYVLTQIAGKPILWFILTFVPLVNFVIVILLGIEVAKKFGKSAGYGLGLVFLSPIFVPMLGFSDAQYDANA
jgi:hypothetical protein